MQKYACNVYIYASVYDMPTFSRLQHLALKTISAGPDALNPVGTKPNNAGLQYCAWFSSEFVPAEV